MDGMASFIIPVYNGEQYIERCLDSICNQTYRNLEIIVIDDGSTDGTLKIVTTIAERDSRIKVCAQRNAGVSAARNNGLRRVSGDYLFFVDADDWIDKNMAEFCIGVIRREKVDIVINDFYYNDSERIRTFSKEAGILDKNEIRSSLIVSDRLNSQCISMYSAKTIKNESVIFPENIKCGEDNIFNILYANNVQSGYYTNRAFYHYEIHEKSGCRRLHDDQLEMYDSQLKTKIQFAQKWEILNEKRIIMLLQLIGTNLSAFTLMASREYQFSVFKQWMDELYRTYQYKTIKDNIGILAYNNVPKSYKILLRLILKESTILCYLYGTAINYILRLE